MPGALLGELPALPLHTAGKYVAGAYVVLFALVLIYLAIMAARIGRIERELSSLLEIEQDRAGDHELDLPETAEAAEAPHTESTLA